MQRYKLLSIQANEMTFFLCYTLLYINISQEMGVNVPPFCPSLRHFVLIVEV